MGALTRAFVAVLLALPLPAMAQLSGRETASGCIDVAGSSARVTAQGRLSLQLFPGPPAYENIAAGDAEERPFILQMPREACIEDGGEFAHPARRFITVHVSAADDSLLAVLSASVGRQVSVSGEAFAAHTGHHHAPLVLLADSITVR